MSDVNPATRFHAEIGTVLSSSAALVSGRRKVSRPWQSARPPRVLLIQDGDGSARLIRELLADVPGSPLALERVVSLSEGLERLSQTGVDAVLLGLFLPDSEGLATLRGVRAAVPDCPIVVLGESEDADAALQAMHEGAQDYLVTGRVTGEVLVRVVTFAIERAAHEASQRLLAQVSALAAILADEETLPTLARRMVPLLADGCIVEIVDGVQAEPKVAVAHADPVQEKVLGEPRGDDSDDPRTRACVGRQSVRWTRPESGFATETIGAAQRPRLPWRVPVSSCLVVPLIAPTRVSGTLTLLMTDSGRRYGEAEQTLAEELADRIVTGLESARLYREAREAARLREQALGFVGHDLRSPLAGIRQHAELVERELLKAFQAPARLPARVTHSLGRIQHLTDVADRLIGDLTDTVVLRGGRTLTLNITATDLVALVREAVRERKETAPAHRFVVQVQASPLQGVWDAARLARVVDNLLGNAVKYSPDGEAIQVRLAREDGPSGATAVLSVRDHGVGIPATEIDRVFELFTRGSNVTAVKGTGLGLAEVRQIVELHGGSVRVESEEGAGSVFTVLLPLANTGQAHQSDGETANDLVTRVG